ncbi:MAG: hypothetical protein P1V36_11365, partial [Planctomycetota bacterium]|nr:hypothetical protein [Planctomycetota bacterium]
KADRLELRVVAPGPDGDLATEADNLIYDKVTHPELHDEINVAYRDHVTQDNVRIRLPAQIRTRNETWRVEVRNTDGQDSRYLLQALTLSTRLGINSWVRGGSGVIDYPNPIIVESKIRAPWAITGLDVRMHVVHPRFGRLTSEPIVMKDDGGTRSGDRWAGDGIYTAMFHDFVQPPEEGDDIYVFDITAKNLVDTALGQVPGELTPALDGVPGRPSIPVTAGFTILDETCAVMNRVPQDGRLQGGNAVFRGIVRPGQGPIQLAQVSVAPVVTFELTARDEGQFVEELTLDAGVTAGTDPDTLGLLGLYLDANKDGLADNELRPLSRARPRLVAGTDYEVTFSGPGDDAIYFIPPGRTVQFVVTAGQPRSLAGPIVNNAVVPGV